MPPTHLCLCSHHNCCNYTDPKTGKRGRELPIRAYNTHQSNEAAVSLQQRAKQAQDAALKAQEDSMTAAFSKLCIPPDTPVLERVAKYKTDRKKALIKEISGWQDEITALTQEVDSIVPGASPPSLSEIDEGLSVCHRLQESFCHLAKLLHNASRGSLRKEASVKSLLDDTSTMLAPLKSRITRLEEEWILLSEQRKIEEECSIRSGYTFDSRNHFSSVLGDTPVVIQLISLMVLVSHLMLGISRRGCQWLFSMSGRIADAIFNHNSITKRILPYFRDTLNVFPKDIRTVTDSFRLEGKYTIYAVCPKCHACHKPVEDHEVPTYTHRCSSSQYGNRCGEVLVRPKHVGKHQVFVPIKPYVVFDFRDWLARLLSRKGHEEQMDKAWDRMTAAADGCMDDIFQGSAVREFMGPDGKTHFSRVGPNDQTARYLFSMGCDFFNPLRNLANGKRVSVGVIALICINLPITIRYQPENIFLAGIIPGPKEPSVDNINSYLGPLVEVFLMFWRGIWFTRTALFEYGRWIFCAIIAVVCDIPAARKVGGFSASSHEYFCSVCWCNLTEHGYSNIDYGSWRRRSNYSCRAWAERYKEAANSKEAASSFDRSGLRCSELMYLPYFDPTKHIVIDPMHNLFLGLIKEHFQNILGYLPKGSPPKPHSGDGDCVTTHVDISSTAANPIPQDPKIRKSIRKLARMLQAPFPYDPQQPTGRLALIKRFTASLHLSALVYVIRSLKCVDYPLQDDGRNPLDPLRRKLHKGDLASILIDWKSEQDPITSPMSRKRGFVFKEEEIQELWNDIRTTVKPSWATSVPDNISSAGAKLKSDQWRCIGALYLPITLIRMWSASMELDNSETQDRHDLLHLTMLLCSAVAVITNRSVSPGQAEIYLGYMTQYRKELKRLFPNYASHPNHHMAMHLGEFLQLYGPVHGWWTFAIERVIGRLQRIRTNYKIGEYESTISQTWTRSMNFHALFTTVSCPEPIRACAKLFAAVVKFEQRNALADNLSDADHENVPEEHDLFTPRMKSLSADTLKTLSASNPNVDFPVLGVLRGRVSVNGVTYSRKPVHEGNSGIYLRNSDTPFAIVDIVQFPDSWTGSESLWFIARRHKRANVVVDPYLRYPHLRAKLWSEDLEERLESFPFSHIETHFAKCPVQWEGEKYVVIVSLSKSYISI